METGEYRDTKGDNSGYSRRGVLQGIAATGIGAIGAGCVDTGKGAEYGGTPSTPGSTATESARSQGGSTGTDVYTDGPLLGGNLNGVPRRLESTYNGEDPFEKSDTPLVRAFFDVPLMESRADAYDSADVAVIRELSADGLDTVISLKWDFAGLHQYAGESLPEPGSDREQELFAYATDIIDAVNADRDDSSQQYVVLGNEPMWEARKEDRRYVDGGVPILEFTDRLKEHVSQHYEENYPEQDVPLLLGALNKLDKRGRQQTPMVREYLKRVRDDADIAGIDLHIHYDTFEQAETMLDYTRSAVGEDSMLMVSEFSPIWRYHRHLDDKIGATASGQEFAEAYGWEPDLAIDEYIQAAKQGQITCDEWTDFMEHMEWYNEHFVSDLYELFAAYDVDVATFGFSQYDVMQDEDWTENWLPFHINFLFAPAVISGEEPIDAVNEPYLQDYRHIQRMRNET